MEYDEVARAESERGEVVLRKRRDADVRTSAVSVLELRVNGVFVMDNVETSSEKRMAEAALGLVEPPRAVVIGGLGLGFTMHEVLADHRVERLVVVEVEEALIQWMRDGTIPHGPAYLADERLTVMNADIRMAMAEATPAAYDLVLLDVDNGPDFIVYDENRVIYEKDFLQQARTALRPGGALMIWSSSESSQLRGEMHEAFGNVNPISHEVTLQQGAGPAREEQYWLYLSRNS